MVLGGSWEAFWWGLGGVLGSTWGVLGCVWGFQDGPPTWSDLGGGLGWSWEAFWGGLGDVLGFSWGVLGCVLGGVLRLGCVLGRLGGDLGVLGCLEGSWGHMGFGSRFREQFGVVNFGDGIRRGHCLLCPLVSARISF